MKTNKLKLPEIFSILEDFKEDLGDWQEQLEIGQGISD